MAQIDISYAGGLIMDGPNNAPFGSLYVDIGTLTTGTLELANSSTYSLSFANLPGVLESFSGSGFTYNSLFTPTGGVVSQFTITLNGSAVLKVTGFSAQATDLVSWAVTDDNTAMYRALLGSANNVINGGPGGDELRGWGATDSIDGGAGNDTLFGGSGTETLFGGDGNDWISGGTGFNRMNGNRGDDTVIGHSQVGDWLTGGQGNDRIDATASTAHGNILNGNLGNDIILGGNFGDTLRGGQGDDVITGGAGNDWITGDLGNDTMTGGAGADTFRVFNGGGQDLITDFKAAEGDRVQLDPGTTYSVSQVGADTVIDLGSGSKTVLAGVALSGLPAGWIFGA